MSTRSSVPLPARKGLKAPQNLCPELCTSLAPSTPGKVLLKSPQGSSLSLSVRPLSLATDLPLIYNWMSQEYAIGMPPEPPLQQLDQAYSSIMASDFAQPFMGMVNDIPVCQIDVYKTSLDAISLSYEARPGDYGLHLLSDPRAIPDQEGELLAAGLRYFFTFPEVGRIITDVEISDKWMNAQARKMGFQWRKKIRKPYKIANLYICTRKSLKS